LTDLAVYVPLDGVLFDDDAFMAPGERLTLPRSTDVAEGADATEELLADCREAVRAWRPDCAFARCVPAAIVETPGLHVGLCQSFERVVADDGLAVVATYAWASGHATDAARWTERIGRMAGARGSAAVRARDGAPRTGAAGMRLGTSPGVAPVLIEMQSYDWDADRWVPAATLTEMVAALRRAGVPNLGVRPLDAKDGDMPPGLLMRSDAVAPTAAKP